MQPYGSAVFASDHEMRHTKGEDMNHADRRVYPRTETEICCKLRRSARTQFAPGKTYDLSASGALLEINASRNAELGERIAVAFSCITCPVTKAAKMIGARVVRADPSMSGRQRIAIEFDAPQQNLDQVQLPMAA